MRTSWHAWQTLLADAAHARERGEAAAQRARLRPAGAKVLSLVLDLATDARQTVRRRACSHLAPRACRAAAADVRVARAALAGEARAGALLEPGVAVGAAFAVQYALWAEVNERWLRGAHDEGAASAAARA